MATTDEDEGGTVDEVRAKHNRQRRHEGEVFMLQSDRSRFVRRSDELDAEIRSLERALQDRELDLESKKTERKGIIRKVQDVDAELLRMKRDSFKQH